jgi:hypothetical protein
VWLAGGKTPLHPRLYLRAAFPCAALPAPALRVSDPVESLGDPMDAELSLLCPVSRVVALGQPDQNLSQALLVVVSILLLVAGIAWVSTKMPDSEMEYPPAVVEHLQAADSLQDSRWSRGWKRQYIQVWSEDRQQDLSYEVDRREYEKIKTRILHLRIELLLTEYQEADAHNLSISAGRFFRDSWDLPP